MKYKVLKDGIGKDGRTYRCGSIVELEADYAEHLISKGIVENASGGASSKGKGKQRAVAKPADLEQAVEEE